MESLSNNMNYTKVDKLMNVLYANYINNIEFNHKDLCYKLDEYNASWYYKYITGANIIDKYDCDINIEEGSIYLEIGISYLGELTYYVIDMFDEPDEGYGEVVLIK